MLDRWLEAEKPHALREDRSDAPLRVCDMCHVALGDLVRVERTGKARNEEEEN